MFCLFRILDCVKALTLKQRQRILRVLSTACEERGTDATGIAVIMGHTRMTTRGSEKFNQNNQLLH